MPAIQTSYTATHAVAFEGMVHNSEPCRVISRTAEAAIGFGKIAVQGATDLAVKPSAAGAKYRGITVMDPGQLGTTVDVYPQYATAAVMTKGVIWVQVSVSVAVADPVYYVPATGVITNVATGNTAIPNAIFDSSTSGAGLAKVRLS